MQWTPEHAQWPEQHFDITSTTRSPAHKVEVLQRSFAAHVPVRLGKRMTYLL